MSKIYFQNNKALISWDEEINAVIVEYFGVLGEDEVDSKESSNIGLELLAMKRAYKWLTDMTKVERINPRHRDWVQQDWRPRAYTAGLRYTAVVLQSDALVNLAVLQMAGQTMSDTMYFETFKIARGWLRIK